MKKINEGLQRGDLNFVIEPVLSIDEYQSKIDDRKAIVVGIYTMDKDPANEIARFIEKSNISILDTDISPAPTEDGFYIAFIELDRNKEFINNVIKIIKEINNITNVSSWSFTTYKKQGKLKFNRENLEKYINLDPKSIEIIDSNDENDSNIEENILSFFKNSLVESVSIDKKTIQFNSRNGSSKFQILKYTKENASVPILICEINDPLLTTSMRLQNLLGNSYEVYTINEGLVVTNGSDSIFLKMSD